MTLQEKEFTDQARNRRDAQSVADYLSRSGKLTANALDRAMDLAAKTGEPLQAVLSRAGFVSERDLAEAFSTVLGLPLTKTIDYPNRPVLADRFSAKFLKESRVIPLEDSEQGLMIAIVDPFEVFTLDAARFAAKKPLLLRIAYPADFEAAYERLYGEGKSEISEIIEGAPRGKDRPLDDDMLRLQDSSSDAPVIRLANLLITQAVDARTSDIHIEPMEGDVRTRFRIDGVLREVESPPYHLASALISRLKIMAKLNIAERRLPQDGRIKLAVRGKDIDFRLSTTPTIHGESIVLRVLDRSALALDFENLGLDADSIQTLRHAMRQPHGILLVTGPTGSGKTTTLYAALTELNSSEKKILSIEDPVEYQIHGVNQVNVKPQIGHTFANALRSFLRQDPDIMLVGEIRDLETAQVSIQAALTGHLILTTLHTNSAASSVTRLLDMGVEPFLVASTVTAIAAQRLVRCLCPQCRVAYVPSDLLLRDLKITLTGRMLAALYKPAGCARCNGAGYLGRTAIIEVLMMTDELRQLVIERASAKTLEERAISSGMRTMYQHGMAKALAGETSPEEVVRVTGLT